MMSITGSRMWNNRKTTSSKNEYIYQNEMKIVLKHGKGKTHMNLMVVANSQ